MNFKSADIKQFTAEELQKVFDHNRKFINEQLDFEAQKEVGCVMLLFQEACKSFDRDNVIIGINTLLVIESLKIKEMELSEESTKH